MPRHALFKTVDRDGQGHGAVDEVWRNSPTNAVEKKHLLIRWVEDVPLGVGCHTPN